MDYTPKYINVASRVGRIVKIDTLDRRMKHLALTIAAIIFSCCLAVCAGLLFYLLDTPNVRLTINTRFHLLLSTRQLLVMDDIKEPAVLKVDLGTEFPLGEERYNTEKTSTSIVVEWPPYATLNITLFDIRHYVPENMGAATPPVIHCAKIQWKSLTCLPLTLEDCVHLQDYTWYGLLDELGAANVHEPYWLSPSGVAVYADDIEVSHIRVRTNRTKLCLSRRRPSQLGVLWEETLSLHYTVCRGGGMNARTMHEILKHQLQPHPQEAPRSDLFRDPLWFVDDVTDMINTANRFGQRRYNTSDALNAFAYNWLEFGLLNYVPGRDAHYKMALKVSPFVELDTIAKRNLTSFLYGPIEDSPILFNDDGCCYGLLDITRTVTLRWMFAELKHLKLAFGVDTFIFDIGATETLQQHLQFAFTRTQIQRFAEQVSLFDSNSVLGFHCSTQHLSHFLLQSPVQCTWNGLNVTLHRMLALSLWGYAFVIPPPFCMDALRGDATLHSHSIAAETLHRTAQLRKYRTLYRNISAHDLRASWKSSGGKVDDEIGSLQELYVRWFQLTAFFPSFSMVAIPWQSDNTSGVLSMIINTMKLHKKFSLKLLHLAREGLPLVRPLWWQFPDDVTSQNIQDQFFLGSTILVAPILTPSGRHRDIYLPGPNQVWWDVVGHRNLKGGRWYQHFKANLGEIPYFIARNNGSAAIHDVP